MTRLASSVRSVHTSLYSNHARVGGLPPPYPYSCLGLAFGVVTPGYLDLVAVVWRCSATSALTGSCLGRIVAPRLYSGIHWFSSSHSMLGHDRVLGMVVNRHQSYPRAQASASAFILGMPCLDQPRSDSSRRPPRMSSNGWSSAFQAVICEFDSRHPHESDVSVSSSDSAQSFD